MRQPDGASSDRAHGSARYLYEIIRTVGAGTDLDAILRGVIQLVTDATGCHGCFVFFVDGDELVLRVASGFFSHAEGRVRLAMGEGLVGWAARMRRSVSIADNALDDPRVLYVPELHRGEPFQSMIAVPVISRTGDAVAVIGMNTRGPRQFEPHEVEFMEHAASLVAGAIENAHLYEDASRRVALLTELSDLAQQVASAASTEELLSLVVASCRSLLAADHCELYLSGPDHRLELRSASPARARGRPVDVSDLALAGAGARARDPLATRQLGSLVWGPEAPGLPMFAPLVVGAERLGLLCALVPEPVPDGERALAAIASHVAVAIKRHQLIDSLVEDNLVKDFFEVLAHGDAGGQELGLLAARLRCDLAAAHVVMHALPCPPRTTARRRQRRRRSQARPPLDWWEAAGRFERALRSHLAGSIFDRRDMSLRALLRVPESGIEPMVDLVRELHDQAAGGSEGAIAAGLSNVARAQAAFAGRFAEADSAARLGSLLRGGAGVATYEELGAYRYALSAESTVRDRYQESVEKLLDYEARRGTDLVGTLDAYLELHGSIARTARRLGTHTNTLRQRLARIEQLTAVQVEHADWVSLAMAIKTVRLRAFRSQR